jgi:hypothetical protein
VRPDQPDRATRFLPPGSWFDAMISWSFYICLLGFLGKFSQ